MNTRIIKAPTSKEALARIHRELGPDATIISHEHVKDAFGATWVEVSVSVPREKADPPQERLTARALLVTALGLVALVIAVIAMAITFWPGAAGPLPPGEKPTVVIMYFENGTGDEKLDHWRMSIADLLTTDLQQSKFLRVIGSDRVYSVLRDLNQLESSRFTSETIAQLAKKTRATHIISGRYMLAGDTFLVIMQLHDQQNGKLLTTLRAEGTGEASIFASVDTLTREIKQTLEFDEETIESDYDAPIETITTSSPEALKLSMIARKLHLDGEHEASIKVNLEAIALDPEFAGAYSRIAGSYHNLGKMTAAAEYAEKALQYVDRLPLIKRYGIEANHYGRSLYTKDKARDLRKKMLEIKPKRYGVISDLGLNYLSVEEYEKAIPYFIKAAEVMERTENSYWWGHYNNIAVCYRELGNFEEAVRTLERVRDKLDTNFQHNRMLSWLLLHVDRVEEAQQIFDIARAIKPDDPFIVRQQARHYIHRNELQNAEQFCEKYIHSENSDHAIEGLYQLSRVLRINGKYNAATEHLTAYSELCEVNREKILFSKSHLILNLCGRDQREQALDQITEARDYYDNSRKPAFEVKNMVRILRIIGSHYISTGDFAEAEATAEEIKEIASHPMAKFLMRYYHLLQGQIELAKNNFDASDEHLEKANARLGADTENPLFLYHQARGKFLSGNLDEAEELFSLLLSRRYYLSLGEYPDYFVLSHYLLGRVCQARGETRKAIEHYEKFLSYWGNADPELTEPDDARIQLANLKNSSG